MYNKCDADGLQGAAGRGFPCTRKPLPPAPCKPSATIKDTVLDCTLYYVTTGALVTVLSLAVAFWCMKRRKAKGNKQKSWPAQEMTPVSGETQDEDVLYREVVFNNHNKMPREKKPEETTYAELRNTSQEDDGLVYAMVTSNAKSKAKNLPQNIDPETTYAEVMPMSGTSEPRDGSNDTYATVNKNRPGRIAQDN